MLVIIYLYRSIASSDSLISLANSSVRSFITTSGANYGFRSSHSIADVLSLISLKISYVFDGRFVTRAMNLYIQTLLTNSVPSGCRTNSPAVIYLEEFTQSSNPFSEVGS